VLITSTPGIGHIGPVAPIARALAEAGHQVRWATAPEACERVAAMGFDVVAAGMNVAERRTFLAPRMPTIGELDPRDRRIHLFTGFFAEAAAPRMHADLAPVFESFRPNFVLHETAELAAAPLAVGRGVPHATIAFSGALHALVTERVMSLLAPIWAAEGVGGFDADAVFGELYFHPFPASFGQSPSHPAVRLMRPAVGAASLPEEAPEWLTGLGVARPLVYLTAGTEAASLLAPWAAALEAVAALDIDVVATTGPMVDQAALGTIPANVRLERFLPQQLLLERAAVVASHGGAGTVLGAARHGVPQLLFPIAADQWENADAVARAGAGLVCEEARRSASELGEALQRLLTEPGHRRAAQGVADEIAQMPAAADHLDEIEALAR
jgi:hypothetical protein